MLWGTVGPVVSLFPEGTAFQYAAVRNVTGTLALWVVVLFSRTKTRYTRADVVPILVGGVGVAAFFPLFAMGFDRTGVAVAAVVAIGVAPIFAGIIAWLALGHIPSSRWAIGTFIAVAGVAALNWPSGGARIDYLGVGFSLAAAFAYSWQATGMGMVSARHNAFQSVAPIFTVGTLLQAPLIAGKSFDFLAEPRLLAGTLYGGLATVAIAYALFTYGMSHVGTATAVTVGLMEPLTATVMGVTMLGEVITPVGIVGLATILVGLVVVSMPERVHP